MKISILSQDKRYKFLCESLCKMGFDAKIERLPCGCEDFIILPVKREHNDKELEQIFLRVKKGTTALSPYTQAGFRGRLIDYSKDEAFLKENAYITAEGAISLFYSEMKESLLSKEAIILGYGRIGKYLAKMLKNQGANVSVFARKKEVKSEIILDGNFVIELNEIRNKNPFVLFNTVPCKITDEIFDFPIIELASSENNFNTKNTIINGRGLPGKMFPKTAAEILLKVILPYLT